jgi:phosphohistidine phosphatase
VAMRRETTMHLYLIRHAEAVPLGVNGVSKDEDRPLTDKGRESCRAVALALRQVGVRLEKLLASPLVRARQTAEELLTHWNDRMIEQDTCDELAPGSKKRKLLREILAAGSESIGLVGHNPDLSELAGWFLGEREAGIDLDKAGVACLFFDGPPTKGAGVLEWLVTPDWCEQVAAAVK